MTHRSSGWTLLATALVALVAALTCGHGLWWADHALQALARGSRPPPPRVAAAWLNLVFNLAPLAVALAGMRRLGPLGVTGGVGVLLAWQFGLYLWPMGFEAAAGIVGLVLALALWSVMRLNVALHFLRWGTAQFDGVLDGLPQRAVPAATGGDALDREMAGALAAGSRLRDVHRLMRDGLDHLADATLVLDRQARVFIANQAAARHWHCTPRALVGRDAHEILADLRRCADGLPMVPPHALCPRRLAPVLGEARDAAGRIVLLRCVPFFDDGNEHAGWMAALVDITPMRRAQHQRDEALRFISHDLRSPSASILTLIELARHQPDAMDTADLLARVERHARAGLELADDFVNLARAEAQPFCAVTLDLAALLQHCVDAAWSNASRRGVRIDLVCAQAPAPCVGDRALLTRALSNVLDNALKFSPPGAAVACSVALRARHWAVSVRDEGPGIEPALQSQLFQPFQRLHGASHPEVQGVGLGLLLVRAVVQRHGGSIEIDSTAGGGCTVTVVLPRPAAGEPELPDFNEED
jgi:signal transduction histidine kinase